MAEGPDPYAGSALSGDGTTRGGPGPSPFGEVVPPTDDPAWQRPTDTLTDVDATRARALVINREIPLVVAQTGWTPRQVRVALQNLNAGLFDWPAQLVDSIVGDSRVQASLASLSGGLFARPIKFSTPPKYRNDSRANECLEAWESVWPTLGTEDVLSTMMQWDSFMGFATGQLLWDTDDPQLWKPHLSPWHPRYVYYHWMLRAYVAISLDGQSQITPGDGHWVLHAPHGQYRGWMRGAVRAVAPWWLERNYALRDASRYSEVHGFPIVKAMTPAGAAPTDIDRFRWSLTKLGQETIIQLPQSADPKVMSYDLQYLEVKDQSWEVFFRLISQCNDEITLAFQGQNLTTEVKEGSLAAARVHGDVRQTILQAKARAFSRTIRSQIAEPFAAINFGDPAIAPITEWDLEAYEDKKVAAQTLLDFAQALNYFRVAGQKVTNVRALGKTFGLRLKSGWFEEVAPLQVEARAAGKTGKENAGVETNAPDADTPDADDPEKETQAP